VLESTRLSLVTASSQLTDAHPLCPHDAGMGDALHLGVARLQVFFLTLALVGCGLGSGVEQSTGADASNTGDSDDGGSQVDAALGQPGVTTVEVSHRREVRGTWVATVSRINWPSATDAAAQRAELEAILDAAKSAGLNTIFFQVRPEADALYQSELEPWSRYLTGAQGVDPGYDPLQFAIEQCHRRGLELHAWLNPYRARAGNVGTSAASHVINRIPEAVVEYGSLRWLDPGHPEAFTHTLAVISDILGRYDIDGLHFDDYFYPYPQSGLSFGDSATYAQYGDGMSLGDWRRDNVNRMVQAVGEEVSQLRPEVRWGISPFGIYRPGIPEGIVGLDQYAELYADPLRWMQEGWVEYLAPQLYWPTTSSGQPYVTLLSWWAERASESGTTLLTGNSVSSGYSLDEYRAEIDAARTSESDSVGGAIWWSVDPIVEDSAGLSSMLAAEYYAAPAATPVLAGADGPAPLHPSVDVVAGVASVTSSPDGIRYWALYLDTDDGWILRQLVPSAKTEFALHEGSWAVSAIDRFGHESRGVAVDGEGEPPEEPEQPTGSSCSHSYGGTYADTGCSASYQCCDGSWAARGACGDCLCVEESGTIGCGT
jgi:uncharacterized lipoprotein YddW (UPF0748 family)